MARAGVQIQVEGIRRWENGLTNLQVDANAKAVWDQAADVYFARTQQYAHVISGDMKRTGSKTTRIEGQTVVSGAVYGGIAPSGKNVNYVQFEIARGGSHDFLGRAIVSTQRIFQSVMAEAAAAMVINQIGR